MAIDGIVIHYLSWLSNFLVVGATKLSFGIRRLLLTFIATLNIIIALIIIMIWFLYSQCHSWLS
jgi:hypothetical protein